MKTGIEKDIEDSEVELEELNECGDLEERMAMAMRIEDLKKIHARGNAKWMDCGLCHGTGSHKEYEDTWPCACCEGRGGSWQ